MYQYNDYELLYLIAWHSEEAKNILLRKYERLVHIILHRYHIKEYHYDDYFQEGWMVVLTAIRRYDERIGKTFCRFLELLVERRIAKLLSKDVKTDIPMLDLDVQMTPDLHEDMYQSLIKEQMLYQIKATKFDPLKQHILREVMIEDGSIAQFCEKYQVSRKEVYNNIYLIRSSLKKKIKY